MGTSERRQRERDNRCALILKAALRVFARRGLQLATVDEIAEAAELAKGTLYYYYPSKDALLEELVLARGDDYFRGLLEGARGKRTPSGIAAGIVDHLLQRFGQQPDIFRVMHMVLGAPEPRPVRAITAFVAKHREWLRRLEGEAHPVLNAHNVPTREFIDLIGTYAHGVLFAAVAGRDPERIRTESTRALKALIRSCKPKGRNGL